MAKTLSVIEVTTDQLASLPWQGNGVMVVAVDHPDTPLCFWHAASGRYQSLIDGFQPGGTLPRHIMGSYTWYGRPNPYQNNGRFILITGIPVGGSSLWRSNGVAWIPAYGHQQVLGRLGPSESQATTAEHIIDKLVLPGDILQSWGTLRVEANWYGSNNANAKTIRVTLADPNLGTEHWALSTGGMVSTGHGLTLCITRTTGFHKYLRSMNGGTGGVGFATAGGGADPLDTSYDFEVRFKAVKAVATDSLQLAQATVYGVYGEQ